MVRVKYFIIYNFLIFYPFYTDKYSVVLTDGSNITNMCLFSSLTPLRAMIWCLRFRHLFPTAPDTLPCFPARNDGMCISL